jgi:uncharacterized protein YkwD
MKQHIMKKIITTMLASAVMFTSAAPAGSLFLKSSLLAYAQQSTDKLTVSYDVVVDSTNNAAMLSAENTYREGQQLAAFASDSGLDRLAVERAKDIALFYSHLRPDNTDPTLITANGESDGDKSYQAENIWSGGNTYTSVLSSWENESSVEGARNSANLKSSEYTHVGIGHVVYNGQHYWVQVFSNGPSSAGGSASTGEEKVTREISRSNISSDVMVYNSVVRDPSKDTNFETIKVGVGESVNLPTVSLGINTIDSVHDSNNNYCPVLVEPVWKIDASNAATLSGNQVKGALKGSANLSLSFSLKQNYNFTIPVNVVSSSIAGATMVLNLPASGYVADGTEKTPKAVITLDGVTLVEDKDYVLTYANNKPAASSNKSTEAKVTATGRGNYTGTREETFMIGVDKGGSLYGAKVELKDPKTEIYYDGKEKKPEVVVTLNGVTVANTYYDVAYSDNTNVGRATVTVTAKSGSNAKYTGSASGTFDIKGTPIDKGTMTFTPTNKQYHYTGGEVKPEPVVKVGSTTLEKDKDFKFTYKNNKQVGKTAEVIATGIGNYSGTLTDKFEIIAGSLSDAKVTCSPETFVYNGMMQIPQAYQVTIGTGTDAVTLKAGTDYAITSYPTTAVDAGTYEVKITGLGSFKGTGTTPATLTATYTILPKDVAEQQLEGAITVSPLSDVNYTGNPYVPAVVVTDNNLNGYTLVEGKDYVRTDSNNLDPGSATVTLEFKGNYSGTYKLNYNIKPLKTSLSSVKAGKKKATVSWKKKSGITGYQLQYARSSSMKSGKKTVSISKASTKKYTVKGLTSKKKYYFRIRTYYKSASGIKVYSSWSSKKSVTIR